MIMPDLFFVLWVCAFFFFFFQLGFEEHGDYADQSLMGFGTFKQKQVWMYFIQLSYTKLKAAYAY